MGGASQLRVRLRSLDEALRIANKHWETLGDGSIAEAGSTMAAQAQERATSEAEKREKQATRKPDLEKEILEYEERWC